MENREAIMTLQAHVVFACEKAGLSKAAVKEVEDALDTAISALKKQEEQEAKCCETCRHRNRRGWEEPCNECSMAYVSVSNNEYEDYYEPYTEEES